MAQLHDRYDDDDDDGGGGGDDDDDDDGDDDDDDDDDNDEEEEEQDAKIRKNAIGTHSTVLWFSWKALFLVKQVSK